MTPAAITSGAAVTTITAQQAFAPGGLAALGVLVLIVCMSVLRRAA